MHFFIFLLVFTVATTAFARKLEESRIYDGVKVSPHEKPFQVLIMINKKGKEVCSGILVRENWVLTTDKCNVQTDTKFYFGTDKWCVEKDGDGDFKNDKTRQIRSVKRVVHHPDGINVTAGFSFDLVELKRPVDLTEAVQVAKLAQSLPKDEEMFEVSGWGMPEFGSYPSCDLLKASVPKISDEACSEHWTLQGNEFCAGYLEDDKPSACNLDWGSPLVKDGLVYGLIATTGEYCGSVSPAVYLPISPYYSWMQSVINK